MGSASNYGAGFIAGLVLATQLHDVDPPAPPAKAPTPQEQVMGTIYLTGFEGNIERVKEGYFPTQAACNAFLVSSLQENVGLIDINFADSGVCVNRTTGAVTRADQSFSRGVSVTPVSKGTAAPEADPSAPYVAMVNYRNLLSAFQAHFNNKLRYFNTAAACEAYVRNDLQEMAGVFDVNMHDTANCYSTQTGTLSSRTENNFWGGIRSDKFTPTPPTPSDSGPYVAAFYMFDAIGNPEREKVTYLGSAKACAAYVLDTMKESMHFFDYNSSDAATCQSQTDTAKSFRFDNTFRKGIQTTYRP